VTDAAAVLEALGQRLRERRSARALTLRELAERAGVSQRFLVSLEAGRANVSVARLVELAAALDTTAAALLDQAAEPGDEHGTMVALLGLRGAGKTAVGQRAAERLALPFVELDQRVAERAGMTLEALFTLHGGDYYRRLEAQELERLLARPRSAIVATGGSIVTHHATYERLKRSMVTVFLRASAEDHWNRVVAQGDARPMAQRRDAMAELKAILRARRALYEQADHAVDTTRLGLERSVDAVVRVARAALERGAAAAGAARAER
jgi:XRE family aerobic/anaerobic benzoate catabolism transcriptional regulator